jgi:hypothetical protein
MSILSISMINCNIGSQCTKIEPKKVNRIKGKLIPAFSWTSLTVTIPSIP